MIEPIAHQAKCILLPSGRDYDYCVKVFEDTFNIKVPAFPERSLSVDKDGRRFVKVKSRDVPMLVQQGFADIGVAYTDICEENISPEDIIGFEVIGAPRLKLCLLSPKGQKEKIKSRLHAKENPLVIATAYPRVLAQYLEAEARKGRPVNLTLSPLVPSGSVEAMVALGVADAAVDVVNTGITAKANHLELLPLADIFPAVVYRK